MYVSEWDLRLPKLLKVFWLQHLFEYLFVAPNRKAVKSERSNFTQVLPEFRFPINTFHVLPKVLKPYFESLEIDCSCGMSFAV